MIGLADGLGFAGGLLLAVCLAPELWHVYSTRSAEDLAWSWMLTYLIGLSLTMVYLLMEGALAGWTTMLVEMAMVRGPTRERVPTSRGVACQLTVRLLDFTII